MDAPGCPGARRLVLGRSAHTQSKADIEEFALHCDSFIREFRSTLYPYC